MSEPIDKALVELQSSLEQINNWSLTIRNSELSASEAIKGAASSMKIAQDAIAELKGNALLNQSAVKAVIKEHDDLGKATKESVGYLRSVNFPARLDKIDGTISLVNQGAQNVSDKLDRVNDQLSLKIDTANQQILKQLSDQSAKVNQIEQKQNIYFIILLVLGLIIIGVQLLPLLNEG